MLPIYYYNKAKQGEINYEEKISLITSIGWFYACWL